MRVIELYSGIGGMHCALKESGVLGEVVAAIEINTVANSVYHHNFPLTRLMNRNIESIDVDEIKKLKIDAIFMSPPCQPFTRVGLQKDKADARTNSLFNVLEIVKNLPDLKYLLLENVVGFEKSETRDAVISAVSDGFNYKELILSPCQFGIPNSRRRYYLLAKKKNLKFCFSDSSLAEFIPKELHDILPIRKRQIKEIHDIIKSNEIENEIKYLLPEKILEKRLNVLDIRSPDSQGSCCFTKAYSRYAEGTGSVYSPLLEIHVKDILNQLQLIANADEKLNLSRSLKLRYFTPCEVAQLMCFPDDFSFPDSTSNKQKYRLLGNSINVHVVSQLIYLLNQS